MVTRAEGNEVIRDESIHKVNCSGCPACGGLGEARVIGMEDEGVDENKLPDILESLKKMGIDPQKIPTPSETQPEPDK